jgi:hypothetical protein
VAQLSNGPDSRPSLEVHGVGYVVDDPAGLDSIDDMVDAAHTHYDAAGQAETRHVHARPFGSHAHQAGQLRMVTDAVERHAARLAAVGYGGIRAELVDLAGEIAGEDLANLPDWAIRLLDRVEFVARAGAEAIIKLGYVPDYGVAGGRADAPQPADPR